MKVAIYIRVSTDDQETGLQSQKRAILRWLKGHGIKKAEWFQDKISGTKDRRPGLDKLRKAIFNGEVQTVVVWSLSRLTRKGAYEGLTMLAKWLSDCSRLVAGFFEVVQRTVWNRLLVAIGSHHLLPIDVKLYVSFHSF